ncbi:hypothetical protein IT774_07465 [Salinimonas marina]|uniref:Uncharacterized protein n=1 Tax=Salinimonas marina TaxID=2785918 RepID=A0A7S9DZY7_9ALTE|nr:hypothetical protein [Salinimonas marina]QPG06932.1 hypothetical protein IT774_07465 [Salinimonas marina]
MRKRKAHNSIKTAERLARQKLKHTAIGCVAAQGPCQLLDLRTQKPLVMHPATFQLISQLRHQWTVYIAVFGINVFGKHYSKSEEIQVTHPQFQRDMVETLNTHHKKLVDGFNPNHLLSVGWLATPYIYEWREEQAFKMLESLGALAFEKTDKNEIYSLIA